MKESSIEIRAGRKTADDDYAASYKTVRHCGYIADYRPQNKTQRLLDQAQTALEENWKYWPLTARQIFYQPAGAHEPAYGRLCHHLANARRGRLIPFRADHFNDRDDFLRHVRELGETYTRNGLAAQDVHMEVWCEAAGMLPQLYCVAECFSVPVYSSGGFDGLTAKKRLADRICGIGKVTFILHLGDYDPSGVSIFDSVAEDVTAFVDADRPHGFVSVEFDRVALTLDQVRNHELPTAPAKASDSRSRTWTGGTCQLEALSRDVIADILRKATESRIDWGKLADDLEAEKQGQLMISGLLPPSGSSEGGHGAEGGGDG